MQPVPPGYPVERLSGPVLIGCLLNWGLFGTLSVQLYLYYLAFPKDRRSIKCLVHGIYIVELVQTVFLTHDAFAGLGYGFGDLEALTEVHFSWLVFPIMGAIAASVGQGFYAYRIFILSRLRTIPALVICVSLTSSVAATITGVYIFQVGDVTKLNDRKVSITLGTSCAGYALCDIVIAICMTYYLMRSNTGFQPTQILVTKLIRLTIETGFVTAVVALVIAILFFVFPHQTFYATPSLAISKLYANSIYMVLNSRFQIAGGRDTYTSYTDMEVTSTMVKDITSRSTQSAQQTSAVPITRAAFSGNDEI